MQNAIILHGRPSKEVYYSPDFPTPSNFAWIPWLTKQLMINDIKPDVPEVPHSYDANFEVWKKEFEQFQITDSTIVVAHSRGAGFVTRYFSENKDLKLQKMILVAPAVLGQGETKEFATFDLDLDLKARVKNLVVFGSDNDEENRGQENLEYLEQIHGIEIKIFKGFGHFVPDHMGRVEFPELLAEIL